MFAAIIGGIIGFVLVQVIIHYWEKHKKAKETAFMQEQVNPVTLEKRVESRLQKDREEKEAWEQSKVNQEDTSNTSSQ